MERYQYNGNDNKWVMKWLELKQCKATTGVWPTTSTLGNFCKYQRDLRKKNVRGQKTTLTAGRIKMLDNIGFPWGSDITPTKKSATTLESNNSNVVSPQEVEDASRFIEELVGSNTTSPLKESTPPQDGRITISVVKPTRDTKLGLSVAHVSDDTESSSLLKVTCISPGSLFDGSSLKEGMIVDTVNGVTYETYKEVLAALQNAEGQMTITTKPRSIEEVTPAVQPLMPTPVDGLNDLLSICELGQYLDKFREAGISSAEELKSKLKDVSFMEQLVDNTGLKASEAIRLQIKASSM